MLLCYREFGRKSSENKIERKPIQHEYPKAIAASHRIIRAPRVCGSVPLRNPKLR